jgi:hypothetical protein
MKKDPLDEAKTYSAILSKHCPKNIVTWAIQYDVSIRRKKFLLALQALLKMRSLDADHPEYFTRLVDFALKIPGFEKLPDAVGTVITEESSKLLNQKSVSEYVSEAADQARQNKITALPARVAIAQGLVKTNPASVGAAATIIIDGGMDSLGVNVESCRVALEALKGFGTESEASTKQWISVVKERFPLISEFS